MYKPLEEINKEIEMLVKDVIPGFDIVGIGTLFGLVYRLNDALIATWEHNLLPDPHAGMSDEEIEASSRDLIVASSAHFGTVRRLEMQFNFPPRVGAVFMDSCRQAGYDDDEDGTRELAWFTDRAARRLNGGSA